MTLHPSPARPRRAALLITSALCATALSSHAALVTWGAATDISGDSDVSTAGSFVGAVMLQVTQGLPSPSSTINGVTFTGVNPFGTLSSGVFSWPSINSGAGSTGSPAPFANLSSAYRDLLGNSTLQDFTLTISSLTVGTTYQFEWWSNYSFNGNSTMASAGNNITLSGNTAGVQGGVGQYAIGTFTADAATQQITFTGIGGAAIVNGFQLRQSVAPAAVPEPGTALAGLLLVGLAGARRRRAAV